MSYIIRQRLRLVPDFASRLARLATPLSLRAFAERAGVSYATVRAAIDPTQQPQRNPQGGIYETTAHKLARAYAQAKGISADQAFDEIIEVELRSLRRRAARTTSSS